jgi:hypothetical protein
MGGLGKHATGAGNKPADQLRNSDDEVGNERDDNGTCAFPLRGSAQGYG